MKSILFTLSLLLGLSFFSLQSQKLPKILQHGYIAVSALYQLNSEYRETNLCITPDGKYLYFMSGRGQQSWSTPYYTTFNGHPEFDGDIWYSQKSGAYWQAPICLGSPVNTEMGEDEPNISPDGQRVYFQSWHDGWRADGGPYYMATLYGNTWSTPVGLGGGIAEFFRNEFTATDGVAISAEEDIFIVATGEDYDGDMDLYISRKVSGRWSYPVRLACSSYVGDDRTPFLASDGRTLYFGSTGYAGWGGMDIFKTTINDNNTVGEIINVGSPFNTVENDYGLILTGNGDEAYFVRNGDIFYANIENANEELKPTPTIMITGKVTDISTGIPLGAEIIIRDPDSQEVITKSTSNTYTGKYAIVIPNQNIQFVEEVNQFSYEPESKNFELELEPGLNQVISDIALYPLGTKEPVVVEVQEEPVVVDDIQTVEPSN